MKRRLLLFSLLMALFAPWAAQAQSELTIYEDASTTSSYVPVYGLWADAYLKCEFVVPASELEEMAGGSISQMTFYLTSPAAAAWTGTFQVFLKEVESETITAYTGTTDAEIVYEGQLDGTQSTMEVPFTSDYAYGGGNLLVGVYQTVKGNYKSASFAGQAVNSASGSGYNSSSLESVSFTQRNFVPKTTFTYTTGGGPVCEKPTDLVISDVTPTGASVAWSSNVNMYNFEYKKSSEAEWTRIGLVNNDYSLTNLLPNTNYNVRVQAVCDVDTEFTSGWLSGSFTTPAGIPLIEEFATTSIPNGWGRYSGLLSNVLNGSIGLSSISSYWYFSTGSNGVFDNHAYINNYSTSHYYWLVTPSLLMEDNVQLSFDLALTKYSGTLQPVDPTLQSDDKFVVLITTDGGTTWEILRQWDNQGSEYVYNNIACSATGEYVAIDLSNYAGENIAVAFYAESTNPSDMANTGGDNNLHIDNVSIDYIPSCPKPTGLTVSEITGHTALLHWIPSVAGQEEWEICLNDDENNLQLVFSTDSTYLLEGLTGQTPYTVKVRAYCDPDDQSPWSNQKSFTTAVTCVAPTALTISNITNHSATLNWTINDTTQTEWIVAYKLTSAHDSTYVELPMYEKPFVLDGLTPETGYTVKVRSDCGEEEGMSTWTSTQSFTVLEAYPAPNNVSCDSVFAYSAYLSWTERGTATDWEVAYRIAGATPTEPEWITEFTPDNHPFVLGEFDPLMPGTDYVFKVRAHYYLTNDTVSEWSNEVTFTTLVTCPAPTDLTVIDSTINAYGATLDWQYNYSDSWNVKYRTPAYVIGIEEHFNTTANPEGWTRYNGLLSDVMSGTTPTTITSGWYFTNTNALGAYHAKVNIYGTSCKYWLVTPELTLAENPTMNFDLALTDYNNADPIEDATAQADDRFVVLVYANNAWTILREWNNSGSNDVYNTISTTGENVSIDISAYQGQTVKIAFYAESTATGGDNDLHIDNVFIGTSVEATEWQNVLAEEVPFDLTGLEPETYYEVVVEGNCPGEVSEESGSVFFTTKPSCLAPTDLIVFDSTITAHTAVIHWTENGTATDWVIEYTRVENDDPITETINVTSNTYMLEGLLDETSYSVRVLAACGPNDESQWSNTVSFTTLVACPAPTELALDSIATTAAAVIWNGTSDNYIVMLGEADSDSLAMGTLFTVNFNNQVIPATWVNDATYPFTVVDGHIQSSNSGVSSSTSSISFTMSFDGEGRIEFDAECMGEGTSTFWDHCDFYIDDERMIYNGANVSGWNHYTYSFAAGTHTFTWSYTKDTSVNPTGDYFAVDNITVSGPIPVASSWTEYLTDETTYTFTELEPGTTYFVQVKGDCGEEGESALSNMISFTTIATCPAPTELSVPDSTITAHTAILNWTGDSESYWVILGVDEPIVLGNVDFAEGIPTTWDNTTSAYPWTIINGYMQSSNGGVDSSTSAIVSDTVNFPADGFIEFDAECRGEGTSTFWDHCDFYIDGTRMLYEGANLTDAGWIHYSYRVTAGAHTFTWSYTKDSSVNASGDYFAVDNVVMKISNIVWDGEPFTANTNSYTFDELTAESTYYTQVQSVCDDESSEWSEVISFTTAIACPAITDLTVDTVGTHMAVISWTETGNAAAWEISVDGDENNLIVVADTTTYMLEGLSQDADHTVKVRAYCGDEDGSSAWSNLVSFHTEVSCAAPTNLAVDNLGTESATLMWEGESDSYMVQYMPWNQVGEDQTSTGVMVTYTYDLSEFEGMGSIAIRHYDVSDLFRLNVDDIVVTNAQDDVVFSEDFEGDISSQLSVMDLDGDGDNWYLSSATDVDAQGNPYCNGTYFITSASYDNTYGALTPDNWLIISDVELGGQLTFVARAQDPEWSAENFAVFVSPEEGAGEEIVDGDTSLDLWDLTPNTTYAWQVAGICDADTSNWTASYFTTLDDVLVFVTDGDWDNPDNWDPAELPTTSNNVRIEANVTIPAGVVGEANKVTIEEGGSITIKDGGQLKQSSATLQVTMEKEITGYGEGDGNYYLIASPFTGRTQFGESSWNHVDSLLYGEYDLYSFDPTDGGQEWVNYKFNPDHISFMSEAQGNAGLYEEIGYLYANQEDITLAFIGKIGKNNNASTEPKVIANDTINKGWALVGNLYACNAYLTAVDSDGEMMEANYYVMNEAGDDLVPNETNDGIAPLNSVFVYLNTTGYYQLHSEMPAPAKFNRTNKFSINLSQDGNDIDKILVRFGKGRNLEKMSLNNNSKLYISMKDKDFAVVYSDNSTSMPVSFNAETAGSYTINCAADGVSFKELLLIDNETDTKVDLLANPSYTFETEVGEFAGRFTIVYSVK
ncbi:MAG: fibronectin type III domain-containing protein [Bacteroidales bacterium]|nr:fibronectin type III domain-containing protein [Bacteroidales bacterium]